MKPGPPQRWLAIVNPAAGGGRCGRRARGALDSLRAALAPSGHTIETALTAARGEATGIARAAFARGVRRFLAVGGDGTAFEILNGLRLRDACDAEAPVLGFLPLGTGNSFVRDFSRDGMEFARDALVAGRRRRVDVLRARHRDGELLALGVVSLGYAADVAALVNRRLKPFGRIGYSLGVVAEVVRLAPRSVRVGLDGAGTEGERVVLLCACNNKHVGGEMRIAPDAAVDDGWLDLVTVGPVGRLDLLRTFPRIFAGTHVSHPAVAVRRAQNVALDLDGAIDVMVDGESLRLRIDRIEVVPRALEVAL